jgi:cytochrome c5
LLKSQRSELWGIFGAIWMHSLIWRENCVDSEDTAFKKTFPMVVGVLVLITVIIVIAARFVAPSDEEVAGGDQRVQQMIAERIKPIGQVQTVLPEGEAASAPATASVAAPAAERSGEEVYTAACEACHVSGAAGAPKIGDAAAWEPRIAQGLDALVSSALNGKGAMPARGGNAALSDDEITKAVKHMTGL